MGTHTKGKVEKTKFRRMKKDSLNSCISRRRTGEKAGQQKTSQVENKCIPLKTATKVKRNRDVADKCPTLVGTIRSQKWGIRKENRRNSAPKQKIFVRENRENKTKNTSSKGGAPGGKPKTSNLRNINHPTPPLESVPKMD